MSRSRKKSKIQGIASIDSEKEDKMGANRKFRRKTKQQVKKGDEQLSELREVSNVWSFGKDGKTYRSDLSDKEMRK